MPERTYIRKDDSFGKPGDPSRGNPSFFSGVETAIPGRTWRSVASASEVTLLIDGGDLTAQEDTDLTAAHTAWVATCQCRYQDNYPVETEQDGKTAKIEWFETDNGDGTYSDLARDEVWTWSEGKLVSIVAQSYQRDGTVVPHSTATTDYYTTDTGKKVKKRSDL
jgi:hypothetical protein